jgi:methionyl-tRNA formyltransferase
VRILFAGSPAIAVPALESLAAMSGGGEIILAGLLTRADSPKGRSGRPDPTECAAAAQRLSIPILKPEKLDNAVREQTAVLKPDLLVSFAYGKIFGPQFLALFPLGGINIHPSLLPKYRGATPIPAAIINREPVTGITIQRLAAEMDSGDILMQEAVPLSGRETTADLSETMAHKAAELLPAAVRGIAGGTLRAQLQDNGAATYCSRIKKEDGLIDWNRSAAEIDAQIRAFDPWPLSWTMHGELMLFVLKAEALENGDNAAAPGRVLGKDKKKGILIQTGEGILAVSRLQYQTKKALEWQAFLNGARDFMGARLGQ